MIGKEKEIVKDRWVSVVCGERPSSWWDDQRGTHLVIAVGLTAGAGLLTFYHDTMTLVLGVPAEEHSVYKDDPANPHHYRTVDCRWIWGRATEPYDLCLDYFGLGPLAEISWLGGARPPAPVRALGRVAGWLSEAIDAVMTPLENRWPRLERASGSMALTLLACRLADKALNLDPAPCYHPACRWSWKQECLFPSEVDDGGHEDE